ncbi:unnamed protein product [Rotaria socialis]|uniref:Uncharacterized protein n=1 Tax=Rotaria socialis TaxID=392032 RepID=A0A818C2B3_9BILA|nr:unnamed protein product [Rotaria socialis]
MSTAPTSNDLSDSCIICSSKHERIRPSLCQCKHCSRSLCFDCMKDHHDELQLSIAQVSNRYNELKQLIDTKIILITKETVASTHELSEWYTTLIDSLTVEKESIDLNIEKEEQKAKEQANIDEDLQLENSISDDEIYENKNIHFSCPDESYFRNRDRFESTSFSVNCMASDGLNILYSTIEDPKRDHIAYCYLDDTNSNYGEIDPSQVWHQPPIVDIVWWNNIKKFICATKNGIYSVEYLDQRF